MDARTLDIVEPQVLVNYPDDEGGFLWHHRVLLHRIADGQWVCLTPDHDLMIHDLAVLVHRLLQRARPFPGDIAAACYVFDPIDLVTLRGFRRDAKLQAAILGQERPEDQVDRVWVVCDPQDAQFGQEVPEDVIEDDLVAMLLEEKGVVTFEGEERFVELVGKAVLSDWKIKRLQQCLDQRVLDQRRLGEASRSSGGASSSTARGPGEVIEYRTAVNAMAAEPQQPQ